MTNDIIRRESSKFPLIHDPAEIEGTMSMLGSGADGGLIVLPDAFTDVHREQIIALAARHRVPTIYGYRYFTAAGGLISYGFNSADMYGRAAACQGTKSREVRSVGRAAVSAMGI